MTEHSQDCSLGDNIISQERFQYSVYCMFSLVLLATEVLVSLLLSSGLIVSLSSFDFYSSAFHLTNKSQ